MKGVAFRLEVLTFCYVRSVRGRQIFRWVTVLLFVLTAWTGYANVFTDDTDVRAMARTTMSQAAGCGEDCKVESLRGERGMFGETIEYDVAPARAGRAGALHGGHYAVVCRRQYISFGVWSCASK